jgi:exo-1,4-beta-D-glucosaminidase
MPQIVPDLVWDKTLPFPLNNTWGYHDACSGNGHWEQYYREMVKRYGEPETMERFCNTMQLMNAIGYQGIFEAAGHKFNDIGGVMLWKLNAAFPSVVWQVYDWFLMPNSGYYFMQNACEPLHIQLNLSNNKVMVLNRTYKQVSGLTAQVNIYSLDSKSISSENVNVSLSPTDIKETSSLEKVMKEAKGVTFVVLNLKNQSGKVISHNVYWISPDGDYKSMNEMAETNINVSVLNEEKGKNDREWNVRITNSTGKIAFFIRPQLMSGGEEILPSFWSESYFTLAPGESTEVTVACPSAKVAGADPMLKVSGWNVPVTEIGLKKN